MKRGESKRDDFEKMTGWMEHTEGASVEELREMRRMMGHDVERSEREFVTFLGSLKASHASTDTKPVGILAVGAERGLSLVQLANATELSVALITKLDRRLIIFRSIPEWVLQKLSEVLGRAREAVGDYLRQGAAFAAGAEYHADEAPTLPEQQDFFEAVLADKTISEPRRKFLLGLRSELREESL